MQHRINYPFRVFISYAHKDLDLVKMLDSVLRELELQPIWDQDIHPGTPFTDAIQDLIARCHIFMPLITENSQERPWVHQETGYAKALNIPILPIAIGKLPGEMIAQLHAIRAKPTLESLCEKLQQVNLRQLVLSGSGKNNGMIEIADWSEERAEMIARYANRVKDLGVAECLRIRAAVSSFSIPNKDVTDPIWADYDGEDRRSDYYHHLQQEERKALEYHARKCGCSMILDPSSVPLTRGPLAKKIRLDALADFLKKMLSDNTPPDKWKILIVSRQDPVNLIMLGDYFVAESRVPRHGGYRQTVFNSHPPTVLDRIHKFDQDFDDLLSRSGLTADESLAAAIAEVEAMLRDLQHS